MCALPEIRSPEGVSLPAASFDLPSWVWPYFRAGGPYTLQAFPPPDALGGHTRSVAASPTPQQQQQQQQQGGQAMPTGSPEGRDGSKETAERGRGGQDELRAPGLTHGGGGSSTSIASTAAGETEGAGGSAAVVAGSRHLLYDTLMQPGGVEMLSFFVSECKCHLVAICKVGDILCGHRGIVHGGFTATIIDNAMGFLAHAQFKRAATKSLSIKYLRPFMAGTTILFDAYLSNIDARGCSMTGFLIGPVAPALANQFPPQRDPQQQQQQQQPQQQQQQKTRLDCLPPRAEGLWVVAAATGEMVDVTTHWKGI
ncbi:hypothetical protein ACSSS7_004325 [Eimeria intestinalis]